MIRIGLMGCGVVADYGHLPALTATPGLQLVALFDPNPDQLQVQLDKYPGVAGFTDQEAFFETPMDAVVVCSPAFAHRDNVLAAAQHGLHVLCEKPIAMDDDEGEEMTAAMEAAEKRFYIGYVYRFSPVAMQLKKWVEEGIAGEIRSLRLIYVWDLHGQYEEVDGKWIESPRYRGRMVEGGPMVDCGVHQIDLARWWLGKEVVGSNVAAAWVADYEAPDHVWLHLDHEGGAHTAVEMSFSYGHTAKEPAPLFSYDLVGTGGVLRYDRNGWLLEARVGNGTVHVPGASEKNFAGMYQEFERALRTGDDGHMPTAKDGIIATRLAREATETAIRNRHAR